MNNISSRFDVALSAYVLNYISGLRERHIPVHKPLGKSLLRYFTLNSPNSYLPSHVIYSFFNEVRKQYGLEFFSHQYLDHFILQNMGLNGNFLVSNNRVLPTLQNLVKYGNLLCTNQHVQLNIKGTNVLCSNGFSNVSGFERNTMEYIWSLLLSNVLKGAEGDLWGPSEILFTGKESDCPTFEKVPETTKICFDQERAGIRFKTSTLAKQFATGKIDITEKMLQPPALSLSGKIEQFLDNMYLTNLASMHTTAEFFGVSVSTLKRHLTVEQINYHEILERWRFMKGVNLLTETNLKIKEISEFLHYANSANFVRAFKRWSGKTPMEYRMAS